jgi:hypothetical protein
MKKALRVKRFFHPDRVGPLSALIGLRMRRQLFHRLVGAHGLAFLAVLLVVPADAVDVADRPGSGVLSFL